jgi:putative transposase
VARRKKGSKRRKKAVALLAKAHRTVARQRRDLHYKTAVALVRQYDVIYHEELRIANMVRNHHLARTSLMPGGRISSPSFPSRQHAPVGKCSR